MDARTATLMARYGIRPQPERRRSSLLRLLNQLQASVMSVAATAAFAYVIYR